MFVKMLVKEGSKSKVENVIPIQTELEKIVGGPIMAVQIAGQYFAVCNKELNQNLEENNDTVSLVVNFDKYIKGKCFITAYNGVFFNGLTKEEIKHFNS